MKARNWDFRNLPSGSQWFQMLFMKTYWLLFIFSLFGDEAETVFWEVALHYLRREKSRTLCSKHQVTYSRTGCSISLPETKTVRLKCFKTMLMLVFFTFFNWYNWKTLRGTDRLHLCEKKWLDLIPRPSLFDQKSWEDEKKKTFKLFWASQRLSNLLKFTVLLLTCLVCY